MARKISLACIWLLALLCFIVPYWVLDQINAWYGSFLFWALAGVLVIVCNFIATRNLQGQDE
ncbi:hypothetical protein [Castellaniella sp.]|uniref:hypothetical protein n=1 Tax=Castellaniella sp. TaxID=1955812 RepID=UPI002AFE3763|nr:hypothetical protein [Castellaniella sp.]